MVLSLYSRGFIGHFGEMLQKLYKGIIVSLPKIALEEKKMNLKNTLCALAVVGTAVAFGCDGKNTELKNVEKLSCNETVKDLTDKTSKKAESLESNSSLGYWVDTAGNQNGMIERLESDYLGLKFQDSKEFYILTGITIDSTQFYSIGPGMEGVFSSEQELRTGYKGIGIKGKVGILRINTDGNIINAWSTSGYLSEKKWKEEKIPTFDYENLMKTRFDKYLKSE
ncbi:MAG: hypothetical protein ABIB71_02735 [Candidatus Woesearchaeota archaeon]